MKKVNLYTVLGLKKDATEDEIKKAYRTKAKDNHPDRNVGDKRAETRYKKIVDAYEVLGNPERRKLYDETGETKNPVNAFRMDLVVIMTKTAMNAMTRTLERRQKLEHTNLIPDMKADLLNKITELKEQLEKIEWSKECLEKVIKRFKTKEDNQLNHIEIGMKRQIRRYVKNLESTARSIALAKECLELCDKFVYLTDVVPPPADPFIQFKLGFKPWNLRGDV